MGDPIEPTPDEAANGWTAEALTRYVADRKRRQAEEALNPSVKRNPTQADGRYDPHKWRCPH